MFIHAIRGTDHFALLVDGTPESFLALGDEEVTFEEHGEAFVARIQQERIGRWESRGAFLADVGAASVLADHASVWSDLTIPERAQLLGGLRLFLDRCPTCDGPLAFGERTVRSCCRSTDVVELACEDCAARLFERRDAGGVNEGRTQ